ncbi:MAG TPA: hypothetical protein VF343_07850, partial [Syntrophales bacterium]
PRGVATQLCELSNPRLLPTRRRLFRHGRVPGSRVPMRSGHVEVWPDKDHEYMPGKLLNHPNHLRFKIDGLFRLPAII